ncbi:MAG: hypothetical protein MUP63_03200 [Candidatus Nanohaloarchaeota archaeon QJJ-7]|nr:hypothetical protein [Candidatus Nanohaloarchaeota archaeon QJJ-7]
MYSEWQHLSEHDTGSPYTKAKLVVDYLEEKEADFRDIGRDLDGLDVGALYVKIRAPVTGRGDDGSEMVHDLWIRDDGEVWTRHRPDPDMSSYRASVNNKVTMNSILRPVDRQLLDVAYENDARDIEELLEGGEYAAPDA